MLHILSTKCSLVNSRPAENQNTGPAIAGPVFGWLTFCLHVDSFVHRNLPAALQDGAGFGDIDRRVERIGLDDGISGSHRAYRAVRYRAVAGYTLRYSCE